MQNGYVYANTLDTFPAVDPHEHGRWIPSESYFDDDDTLLDVDDWCDGNAVCATKIFPMKIR